MLCFRADQHVGRQSDPVVRELPAGLTTVTLTLVFLVENNGNTKQQANRLSKNLLPSDVAVHHLGRLPRQELPERRGNGHHPPALTET